MRAFVVTYVPGAPGPEAPLGATIESCQAARRAASADEVDVPLPDAIIAYGFMPTTPLSAHELFAFEGQFLTGLTMGRLPSSELERRLAIAFDVH